ncbi:glycine--tRNA ligase subunit beta [Helicobacter mesocricetorum]|uniref:glycine--tRNA ligase subunit beta n=1 Tax=Helicobacter mesocricetorum TaxID=87012 RepID=UPI000CF11C60|nr:glycine--tRNA ligase subunit beta [Helicobacter mesocricetorum]
MTTSLLLEIGTEELPAIPLLRELPNIKNKFANILKNHRLDCEFDFFYTPRRLVILSYSFPLMQKPEILEFFGPPLEIAYKDNQPTQAALSFFKKCAITQEESSTIIKGDKEILYCKKESLAKSSKELLQTITQEFLHSLNFGKTMRWGMLKEAFIRPISWILALIDETPIPLNLYGIESKNQTFIHRNLSYQPQEVRNIQEYLAILQRGKILLDPNKRRAKILEEIKKIEQSHQIRVEIDKELLEEVISITEYPTALLGEFHKHFLELPEPCIITSMKVHQRYFATYQQNKLYNGFVMVSNSLSEDSTMIIQGNLKVLSARLEDALFFYHNDLKNGLKSEKLQNITFVEGLGSMWDKAQRERAIAKILITLLPKNLFNDNHSQALEIIDTALSLSKADLMSEMVYEFTELQGIMGYYYARSLGYEENIALAIKEQYLPNTEESELPSNLYSAIVALAYKLDNLLALFSVHKIPSGSKDPFALRRAANGVIKILLHFNLSLSIKEALKHCSKLYQPFDDSLLEAFLCERLESLLSFNPSLLRATLATGERDIVEIKKKLEALDLTLKHQDKALLTQTFKRLANITKEVALNSQLEIQEEYLMASEEITLYKTFCQIEARGHQGDYTYYLQELLSLAPLLNRFFDKVLVNAPDENFKNNRKHLIARIYKAFLNIADIKEISL